MDAARLTGEGQRVGAPRDRVTIDLRGLGPRIHAQATKRQMTAAELVRRAVMSILDEEQHGADHDSAPDSVASAQAVKVTLRMSAAHAFLLASRARVADVSQGRYVAGLIDGMPVLPRATDHGQAVAVLMASTDRLAVLSADLNAFMRLLGRVQRSELEPFRASLRSLGTDVHEHLASAAALVASLRAAGGRR